jgi:hypothetical protein
MKKGILALIFTTFIMFSATGCGKKDSPETAAVEFINSLKNGDTDAFKKYSTPNTQAMFALMMATKCSKEDMNNNTGKCLKLIGEDIKDVKVVKVTKNGDNKAVVSIKETLNDGQVKNGEIPVIKTKDGWKVYIKK